MSPPDGPGGDASHTLEEDLARAISAAAKTSKREIESGERADLSTLRGLIEELWRRAPGSGRLAPAERRYLELLGRTGDQAGAAQRLERLASSANSDVADLAIGLQRVAAARHTPLELSFTAVDGRSVELTALRGRIVLIDFWATWCSPCLQELPNLKAAYEKHHAFGFEILGISFDRAPQDPAAPAPGDRALEQFREFTAAQALPWPQYYDGLGWKNAIGQRFAIGSIPTFFLLDGSGRLVTTDCRAEKLDREVSRLLAEAACPDGVCQLPDGA